LATRRFDKTLICRGGKNSKTKRARHTEVCWTLQGRENMAELEVKERQAGDVTILDLSGSVRMGEGAISLRNSIRGLAERGKKKILLNLGGVKNIDSSGIGELIANYTTISRDHGQLKLLNLTDKIRDLLVITKLLTVFDAYDNEAEALNSFK
jgi:anti-sigma B factor antagonist